MDVVYDGQSEGSSSGYSICRRLTADNDEIVICFQLRRIREECSGGRGDEGKRRSKEGYKTRDMHGSDNKSALAKGPHNLAGAPIEGRASRRP